MRVIHSSSRFAFTLLELLTVMGIAALLVTTVTPALTKMGKPAELNGSGNTVANLMNFARQNALSKNAMTALVLVTDASVTPQNRLLTVLELPVHSDNSTQASSSDWKQITKWETLDAGVVISDWTYPAQSVSPALPQLLYGGKTLSSFKYLLFLPNGSIAGDSSPTVQLVEGYMPKGGSTPLYTGAVKNGTPANYYKLTVLNATGRVKIDRP
ncbi:MAG: Tfp pilus assembly protein FimT/FimU [Chthoniobacteraceae bacterium]